MADAKDTTSKKQADEEVGVAERLTNVEAHPSQTDRSKPAPEKPKPEKG